MLHMEFFFTDMSQDSNTVDALKKMASVVFGFLTTMGTTAASMGAYYATLTNYREITGTFLIPYATLVWSLIVIVVSVLAQIAMRQPSKGLLGATILLSGFTAAGIGLTTTAAISQESTFSEVVSANFRRAIMEFPNSTALVDQIQRDLECCGDTDHSTYATLDEFRHGAVPASCCIKATTSCGPPLDHRIFLRGCVIPLARIMSTATSHCSICLGLVGAAMAVVWGTFMVYLTCCV